jgi:hypothetical protein
LATKHDARIVDQNVDRAHLCGDLRSQRGDACGIGHIDREAPCRNAQRLDLSLRLRKLRFVEIRDHDLRPATGELHRHLETYALGAARDQYPLAI